MQNRLVCALWELIDKDVFKNGFLDCFGEILVLELKVVHDCVLAGS